jgi:hypothetical protein
MLFSGAAFGQNTDKKPVKEDPMTALAPFVGEWHIEAKWNTGEKLKARGIYDWGLGKKILVTKTFVGEPDKEYQRYEGVMTWHPAKKSLYQITFAYDGSITETMIETKEKDTLHLGYVPFTEGKPSLLRQTIRFTDKDHFVWTVQLKQGDDWKQLIEGTWVRKGAKSR